MTRADWTWPALLLVLVALLAVGVAVRAVVEVMRAAGRVVRGCQRPSEAKTRKTGVYPRGRRENG